MHAQSLPPVHVPSLNETVHFPIRIPEHQPPINGFHSGSPGWGPPVTDPTVTPGHPGNPFPNWPYTSSNMIGK